MTLLDDVQQYLTDTIDDYYFEADDLAEKVGAAIEETNILIENKRWGDLMGTVFARSTHSTPPFEYVMVSEYVFDEGAEGGDKEISAYSVKPHTISKVIWM